MEKTMTSTTVRLPDLDPALLPLLMAAARRAGWQGSQASIKANPAAFIKAVKKHMRAMGAEIDVLEAAVSAAEGRLRH
jgi:hypothetical protein